MAVLTVTVGAGTVTKVYVVVAVPPGVVTRTPTVKGPAAIPVTVFDV